MKGVCHVVVVKSSEGQFERCICLKGIWILTAIVSIQRDQKGHEAMNCLPGLRGPPGPQVRGALPSAQITGPALSHSICLVFQGPPGIPGFPVSSTKTLYDLMCATSVFHS